ncbi:60Kd inner membrane protein-domain-containing protein, partial [Pelagophyceae sp. CCMP2097]
GTFGISIVLFTLAIKLATFPLNFAQIESTTKMQALQPAIKRIQAKYANDPQQMNVMMAELYSENELNPLAGCLPAFAQIPIFIALYRALINLAKEDLLEEPFLWLPNLEGPTYGAQNADWLFKFDAWNGNAPPLGWHDTIAYLTLPTGPETDQQQTTNAVLKYLPLLVGVFSLNVPSGLTVYWFVNNIFTTASTLYIRSTVGTVTMGGADVAAKETKKSKKSSEATSFDAMMVRHLGDEGDSGVVVCTSQYTRSPGGRAQEAAEPRGRRRRCCRRLVQRHGRRGHRRERRRRRDVKVGGEEASKGTCFCGLGMGASPASSKSS